MAVVVVFYRNLCRLGGSITGIDASYKNIEVAKIHAKKNNLNINYFYFAEKFIPKKFDIVLNMEIVEHVSVNLFIKKVQIFKKKINYVYSYFEQNFKIFCICNIGC